MATEKKPLLNLPLKVILTQEGASHFINRKKKLLRFRLADNAEEFGVSLSTFAPLSLQSMILVDYVSKIEISMPEFVSSRQEIMDLSKLVVFSVLYKQFDREVLTALLATECVRKHNRANPSQLLDEQTHISVSSANGLLPVVAPVGKWFPAQQDYLQIALHVARILQIRGPHSHRPGG